MRLTILSTMFIIFFTATTSADNNRARECKNKLDSAASDGIISEYGATEWGAVVVIPENLWQQMPYTTKVGITRVLSCWFLDGDESKQAPVTIRGYRTNKTLAVGYPSNLEIK